MKNRPRGGVGSNQYRVRGSSSQRSSEAATASMSAATAATLVSASAAKPIPSLPRFDFSAKETGEMREIAETPDHLKWKVKLTPDDKLTKLTAAIGQAKPTAIAEMIERLDSLGRMDARGQAAVGAGSPVAAAIVLRNYEADESVLVSIANQFPNMQSSALGYGKESLFARQANAGWELAKAIAHHPSESINPSHNRWAADMCQRELNDCDDETFWDLARSNLPKLAPETFASRAEALVDPDPADLWELSNFEAISERMASSHHVWPDQIEEDFQNRYPDNAKWRAAKARRAQDGLKAVLVEIRGETGGTRGMTMEAPLGRSIADMRSDVAVMFGVPETEVYTVIDHPTSVTDTKPLNTIDLRY